MTAFLRALSTRLITSALFSRGGDHLYRSNSKITLKLEAEAEADFNYITFDNLGLKLGWDLEPEVRVSSCVMHGLELSRIDTPEPSKVYLLCHNMH